MYSEIKVAQKTAVIHVHSGYGSGPYIKLIGSTFPIVPAGTVVDKLSVKVPDGLQGVAFFCKVEEPRRVGSGKTAYLDLTPRLSTSVLLIWEEDDKLIVKADKDMSESELARFNPFVRSYVDLLVVDLDRKIVYVLDLLPRKAVDPMWTYKSISMEAILDYITKRLTLEELDQRANFEQRACDELMQLRDPNLYLRDSVNHLSARVEAMDSFNEPATP